MKAKKGTIANTDVKDITDSSSVSSMFVPLSNAFLHQTIEIRGYALSGALPLSLGYGRYSEYL